MDRVYLDHNATTPLRAQVLGAMEPYLRGTFGNPSSLHWHGQQARRGLDRAREQVAALIHARPEEIVFCSGGTEANNMAIRGTVEQRGGASPHVITSAVEHQAVLRPCQDLASRGCQTTHLGVTPLGEVPPQELRDALASDTTLVSIMLANNDVGTIQPLEELAAVARERGVAMHTDAVQAVGRIPVDVRALGVDMLSLSGHKLGGPKGVGAIYVRRGFHLRPQLLGGGQERRRRAGTENLPGIVGLGAACELAAETMGADSARMRSLLELLETRLLAELPGLRTNGHPRRRLPNTLNVTLPGLSGEDVMLLLDGAGISASVGSACSSGDPEPSYVLIAMGASEDQARSSLRFSLGPETTAAEIHRAVKALVEVVETMGGLRP